MSLKWERSTTGGQPADLYPQSALSDVGTQGCSASLYRLRLSELGRWDLEVVGVGLVTGGGKPDRVQTLGSFTGEQAAKDWAERYEREQVRALRSAAAADRGAECGPAWPKLYEWRNMRGGDLRPGLVADLPSHGPSLIAHVARTVDELGEWPKNYAGFSYEAALASGLTVIVWYYSDPGPPAFTTARTYGLVPVQCVIDPADGEPLVARTDWRPEGAPPR